MTWLLIEVIIIVLHYTIIKWRVLILRCKEVWIDIWC